MSFNDDIKAVRQKSLLSQEAFAQALGVSFTTVNRWESGKSKPSYKAMKMIDDYCKANGIDFDITKKLLEVFKWRKAVSFVCETHQESIPIELLKGYFSRNGFLLCNECRNMPSLFNVGGDWNSIVQLIEEGQVFYSKLYKGRVTYLSREFYAQVKPYRQRMELISSHSRLIYNLLDTIGYANAQDIKRLLNLSNKVYTDAMHELSQELLITAIQRDKTINQNWSSFYWGTYKTWESLHPISDIEVSTSRLKQLLDRLISEKEIHKLLQ